MFSGSINLICVPVGSLLSGVLTQPFGRKPSMIVLNLPFIGAWLVYHFANSVGMLYAALVLTGFSGGVMEAPVSLSLLNFIFTLLFKGEKDSVIIAL